MRCELKVFLYIHAQHGGIAEKTWWTRELITCLFGKEAEQIVCTALLHSLLIHLLVNDNIQRNACKTER